VEASAAPISLKATGRARRRLTINRSAQWIAAGSAFLAVGVLGVVIVSVLLRGIPALNLDLFTQNQVAFGQTGGGIENAIVGTAIMVGLATAVALPVGILVAIYVAEFAPDPVGRTVRLALDVLNGVPSIVIGIFMYALLVVSRS